MRKLLLALIVLSIIPFALSDYSTQCSANACINTKLANGITGPSNPFDPAKSCGGGCCEESGFCITTIHFNNAFNGGSCEISGLHGSINNCNTGTRTITNSDPLNVVAYYDFKNITGANGMNLGNFDGTALNFNKPGIGGNWSGFSVWSNGSNAKISIGGTECTTQNCYLSAFNPPQNSGKYSFTSDYPGLKDYLNSGTLMIGAAMHSPEAGTLTGFYNESKFYFNIVNNSSTLKQLVYEGYDPNSNPTPGPDIVRLRASPAIPTPGIPYINVEKLCNTPCRITSTNNGQVVNTPINEGTTSIPFLLSPNTVSGWSDSVVCRDFFSYIKVFPNAFPVTGIFNYHKTEMPLSSTVHYDKACIEPAAFNGEFYSTSFEAKNWTLKYGINASPISSMKFKVLVVGSGGNLLTWQDKTSFSACNSTPGSSGNYYNCSVNILLQKPADNAINSIITSNDGTINPIFEVYTKIGGVDTLTDRFKFLFQMWGIMGLKTSPTGQYLKFATGKSNILAGNGLDVSIRNISDDGAPKSITFKCISGSNCDNIASLICTPGTSTLSTPCNTASLKGTGITFTGVNFFGRADAGTPKITANFTDSGTYKFQATISTAVPKTETLTVIVSGPSVEITGINFFQNSKDVGTLVDKEKGDLTVKITVKNNGIDMGWTGFMLLTVKDSKGTDIAASMDNLTPFQQLSGTKIFSFKIPANCTAGEVCLRDFEEGRNYSAVAVLERRASPFIYLGTLEKSFIVKQKQANVPELPLPLVLLCFAVVVVLAGFKAKRAD